MGKPQDIQNPRRILAVALEGETEQLARVVKDLIGTRPEPASSSLAGTTHDFSIQTAYYTATVPIWLDLITAPSEWAGTFLSDEAKEVLEVLGGVVAVFAIPSDTADSSSGSDQVKNLIGEVGKVVKEGLGGWEWDGVSLAVGVGEVAHLDDLDVWDEVCGDAGLEFVHVASSAAEDARNEFGEKVGINRVLEALQSNDWASVPAIGGGGDDDFLGAEDKGGAEGEDDDDDDLDPENLDFGFDREEFEGLKKAIWEARMEREGHGDGEQPKGDKAMPSGKGGEDGEDGELDDGDVQQIEQMMRKLQAVRDMSAGLPEDQRKRVAARAVGEVMRDL